MTGDIVDLKKERAARKPNLGNRVAPRRASQRRARLVLANGIYDCIVTDVSERGARVRIDVRVAADGNVVLDAGDGNSYPAIRRWARGMEMGLAFVPATGAGGIDHSASTFAAIWASAEAVKRLRHGNFIDDPSTLQAAEEAERALVVLISTLETGARGPG